jgi:hypothetical protein
MAELKKFKCKKCGWSIEAPKDGADFLMDGLLACFVCGDCKHVFIKSFALGIEVDGREMCPKCNSCNTKDWKPADNCPECGGELENQGLYCLED